MIGGDEKDRCKVIAHDSSDSHENQLLDATFTFQKEYETYLIEITS